MSNRHTSHSPTPPNGVRGHGQTDADAGLDAGGTVLLPDTDAGITSAAVLLAAGELVSFATETVYGLGADARNDRAVAMIFAAKGRPHFNPLIVHVPDLATAETYGVFSAAARALAQAFWPGPLTLVVPLRPDAGLSPLVSAGLDSVALRVPAHAQARALLRAFGGPVAAPSANPSGKISPTRAEHVMAGLAGRIAAVLEGGACMVGLESTILGLTGAPTLLRPGGLAAEDIETRLGAPLLRPDTAAILAPGMMASHYAPDALLRLNAKASDADELMIGFGDMPDAPLNLSPTGDLIEAAANLFHLLRRADALAGTASQRICVAPIPDTGLGRAINDRLNRAAAPR